MRPDQVGSGRHRLTDKPRGTTRFLTVAMALGIPPDGIGPCDAVGRCSHVLAVQLVTLEPHLRRR